MNKISKIMGSALLGIVLTGNCIGGEVVRSASNTPMKVSSQDDYSKAIKRLSVYEMIFGKRDYVHEERKVKLKLDFNPFSLKPFNLDIDYSEIKNK